MVKLLEEGEVWLTNSRIHWRSKFTYSNSLWVMAPPKVQEVEVGIHLGEV